MEKDVYVITKYYTGTSIAVGVARGLKRSFLEVINSSLYKEDLAFLFTGRQFIEKEEENKYEGDKELTDRIIKESLKLAKKNKWHIINSNRDRDDISEEIWNIVYPLIK